MLGNLQTQWARLFVDGLVGAGVRHAVVSPGSRSTPFAWAVLEHANLDTHSVIDERSAGFFALGLSKASGASVLLLCTSGSAGAHYLPALIEAKHTKSSLVVVTADRPFRLMKRGASQTIDQTHLFGNAVSEFFELGAADESLSALRALQQTAVQAVWATRRPGGGPVHVNARADKPLEPRAAKTEAERQLEQCVSELIQQRPTGAVSAAPEPDSADFEPLARSIEGAARGLIVCGTLDVPEREGVRWVSELARRTHFGVLAEVQSQLGLFQRCENLFRPLASFAGLAALAQEEPDFVLELGAPLVSRHYEGFATRVGRRRHVVAAGGWSDLTATAESVWQADPLRVAERLVGRLTEPDGALGSRRKGWLERLERMNEDTQQAISRALEAEPFSEAHAARAIARRVPEESLLVLGNSLPIRAFNAFAEGSERRIASLVQRGASGIDGMVAGALGAAAMGQPTTLVLGDVTLAHDLGSLQLMGSRDLVMIVIDNEGGRIFDQLPWGLAASAVKRQHYWTTPPKLDLEALCTAFGVGFASSDSGAKLDRALESAYRVGGPHLVQVKVSPESYKRVVDRIERELGER